MGGDVLDDSASNEPAGAIGSLVFVGQIFHIFGSLVEYADFSNFHYLCV